MQRMLLLLSVVYSFFLSSGAWAQTDFSVFMSDNPLLVILAIAGVIILGLVLRFVGKKLSNIAENKASKKDK